MKILLAYFSWRGATLKLAKRLMDIATPHRVDLLPIIPRRDRVYFNWLILSLIPGSRVSINVGQIRVSDYDLILLGCPKWSLSCPPFNQFLKQMVGCRGKPVAHFMTFGGFDSARYQNKILKDLANRGLRPVGSLAIRRRLIGGTDYLHMVDEFWIDIERRVAGETRRP